MKRNYIPLTLMLIAGAFTIILTSMQDYPTVERFTVLFAVMLLFYLLGSILLAFLNSFEKDIKRKEDEKREAERKAELERLEKEAQEAKEAKDSEKVK